MSHEGLLASGSPAGSSVVPAAAGSAAAGSPTEVALCDCVCKLGVNVEMHLSGWDGNHPPVCRVWLGDDWTQEISKKTQLKVQPDKTDTQAKLVMEAGQIELHKGYRYLVIDFHKQFYHEKDPTKVAKAAANSFEPELGQLKVNLNDVLQTAAATIQDGNKFKLSFCRDEVFITADITVTLEDPKPDAPNLSAVVDMMCADPSLDSFYSEAIASSTQREEWLKEITDSIPFQHVLKFLGIKDTFFKFFKRSQNIGKDAVEALPHERWMRGKLDDFVAGPAVALAVQSLIVVLVAYSGFAYLFGFIILPSCGKLGDRQIAQTPSAFYVLFLVFALWKLRAELKMMAAVLPLRVLVAGRPNYLGSIEKLSCGRADLLTQNSSSYLLWKIFNSFLASFDIFSASLFFARIRATRVLSAEAHVDWNIESVWRFSLGESELLRDFLDDGGWYPTFLQLTVASWLMFFLQVLYSLAYSIPTSWEIQSSARPAQSVTYDFREGASIYFPKDKAEQTEFGETFRRSGASEGTESKWLVPSVEEDWEELHHTYSKNDSSREQPTDNSANQDPPATTRCAGLKRQVLGFVWHIYGVLGTIGRIFVTQPKTNLVQLQQGEGLVAVADYATYTTLFCSEQTHSRALAAVARTGRLAGAQSMEPEYLKIAITHWQPHEILQALRQQNMAFVVFMLQKLLSTSMQASLVGISANLSVSNGKNAGADPLTEVTVLLSCILGLGAVWSATKSCWAMCGKVLDGVNQKLQAQGVTKLQEHHEFMVGRTAVLERAALLSFSAWSLCFLLWCATKTLMAGYCQCGMWNFNHNVFYPSNWGNDNDWWRFLPLPKGSAVGCVFFTNSTGAQVCKLSASYVQSHFEPQTVNFTNISQLCSFF